MMLKDIGFKRTVRLLFLNGLLGPPLKTLIKGAAAHKHFCERGHDRPLHRTSGAFSETRKVRLNHLPCNASFSQWEKQRKHDDSDSNDDDNDDDHN